MCQVGAIVKELFGKEPSRGVNPDEVVAMGAAIQVPPLFRLRPVHIHRHPCLCALHATAQAKASQVLPAVGAGAESQGRELQVRRATAASDTPAPGCRAAC